MSLNISEAAPPFVIEKEFTSIGPTFEVVQDGLLGGPYFLVVEFDDGTGIPDRYMYGIATHVDVSAGSIITMVANFFAGNTLAPFSIDASTSSGTDRFGYVINLSGVSSQPNIGLLFQGTANRNFSLSARAMTGTLSNIKFSLTRF